MSNKLWFKGGKLLADQNGRPYLCGKCPCGNEEECAKLRKNGLKSL